MFVVHVQKTECGWGRMDFITVKGTLLLHANQTGTSLYVWWPKQVLFISSFNEMMSCTNRFVTAYFTKVTLHNEKKQKKTDFGRSRKSPYSKPSLTRENLFDSVWSSITVTPYLLSCIRWTTPFKVSWELKGSRKTFGQVFLPEIKNSN